MQHRTGIISFGDWHMTMEHAHKQTMGKQRADCFNLSIVKRHTWAKLNGFSFRWIAVRFECDVNRPACNHRRVHLSARWSLSMLNFGGAVNFISVSSPAKINYFRLIFGHSARLLRAKRFNGRKDHFARTMSVGFEWSLRIFTFNWINPLSMMQLTQSIATACFEWKNARPMSNAMYGLERNGKLYSNRFVLSLIDLNCTRSGLELIANFDRIWFTNWLRLHYYDYEDEKPIESEVFLDELRHLNWIMRMTLSLPNWAIVTWKNQINQSKHRIRKSFLTFDISFRRAIVISGALDQMPCEIFP